MLFFYYLLFNVISKSHRVSILVFHMLLSLPASARFVHCSKVVIAVMYLYLA